MDKRDRLRPGEVRAIIVDGVEKYAVLGHHMPVESWDIADGLAADTHRRCGGNSLRGCGRDKELSEFEGRGKGYSKFCRECDDRYRWGVRVKARHTNGSICDWCAEFVEHEEIRPEEGPVHLCQRCLDSRPDLNFPHWPGRWYKGEDPDGEPTIGVGEDEGFRSYGPMPDFGRSSW